ncbi:hypothetical protein AgCh_004104 [Apium graveolens]
MEYSNSGLNDLYAKISIEDDDEGGMIGQGGGLALIWKNEGGVEIKGSCNHYIDFEVIGDFNDMLFGFEKVGGRPHPRYLLKGFSNTFMECGLEDLGFNGSAFTWEKSRGTEAWIQERLDRGFASDEWRRWFPNAEVRVIERAKQFWLEEGDQNTRFFHKFASGRKKTNQICRLKDKHGEWKSNEVDIQEIIIDYFSELFTSLSNAGELSSGERVQNITEEQNWQPLEPISNEEVKCATFSMHPEKSPGYDGLNPSFYQAYWSIIEKDVVGFCQNFFNTGELQEEVNHTVVCLIPKVKQPQQMSDLRPISLCSVLFRILSKMMVNRLKVCLPTLISSNQSAFVEGRLLTDNALIAFEVNHYIKRRSQGINGVAGLKIDVSKAYDRLEWTFIEGILKKFGFYEIWIQRVMMCIKLVTYNFLQHGSIFGDIRPKRGIRQGDPMSPYIYILCAEGLSSIIKRNEEAGLIHGCSVARGAPAISHLLFADDCYFFFKAIESEARVMKNIIKRYEELSGQAINFHKSTITFSPNTLQVNREAICVILEVSEISILGKYLGLPMNVGRRKNEVFNFLSDRVRQKFQSWRNTAISKAGMSSKYRYGYGETVIWKVPWLPDRENGYITSEMPSELEDATVMSLMGEFSVKSCYRKLVGEYSTPDAGFWKKIWALEVPGKIIFFIWRTCRLCLPTAQALIGKRVQIDSSCSWCRTEYEDAKHVLFECSFASLVWEAVGLREWIKVLPGEQVMDTFKRLFRTGTKEQYWRKAQMKANKYTPVVSLSSRKWQKPQAGWVKINVNAATFTGTHLIGIGGVIRGDNGEFLRAMCQLSSGTWQVREAEAISLKEMLSWTKRHGFSNCVFETDSKLLADAFNGGQVKSYFHSIVRDCVELSKNFENVLVHFVHSFMTQYIGGIKMTLSSEIDRCSPIQESNYSSGEEVTRTARRMAPTDFMLKIENFSLVYKAMENYLSSSFEAGGYKWRLSVHFNCNKNSGEGRTGGEGSYISVYLVFAEPDVLENGLAIDVNFKFFVYDQIQKNFIVFEDATVQTKKFHKLKRAHGILNMMPVHEFCNASTSWRLLLHPRWDKKCLAVGVELADTTSLFGLDKWLKRSYYHQKLYTMFVLAVYDQFGVSDVNTNFVKACWGVFSGATTCKVNKNFMDLTELHDSSKGFLVNDALTIGAEIHHIYYDIEI